MKIANEQTFQQFDKLKEQMFAHKQKQQQQQQQKKPPPNPISARFRLVLPLTLMMGGLWLVYTKAPSIEQELLRRQMITYQQWLFWQSFKMYEKCRWLQFWQGSSQHKTSKLANKCYITRLESDYLYLTAKAPQKKLSIQTKSRYSFWIFGVNNLETIKLVNEHGDLVERKRQSKVMLGNLLRIWATTNDSVLQRDRIFGYYQREIDRVGKECQKMNFLNKLQKQHQEYTQILKECNQQADQIRWKIARHVMERKQAQKRKKTAF